MRLKSIPPNHMDLAPPYNNYTGLYESTSPYDISMELCNQSIEIKLNSLSPNYIDIGASYNIVVNHFQSIGKNDEAMK